MPYVKWRHRRDGLAGGSVFDSKVCAFRPALAAHAEYAAAASSASRLEISDVMFKHQLRLADRQCRMAELSQRHPGPCRDARDQSLGRPAVERGRARRRRQSSART